MKTIRVRRRLGGSARSRAARERQRRPCGRSGQDCHRGVTTANDGKSFVLTEASKDMQAPPKTWTLVASDGVRSQQVRQPQG
jgi:hypothetical protein